MRKHWGGDITQPSLHNPSHCRLSKLSMISSSTMKLLTTLGLLAVTSSAHVVPRASSGAPTVTVTNGTISGLHSDTYNQDFFLGIPYAQPPVGPLRFMNPQSINSTYPSTLEATEYAPECVGYGGDQIGYPVSEDCLVLNVVRPSGYEGQDLPVGVWIHGGGLFMVRQ